MFDIRKSQMTGLIRLYLHMGFLIFVLSVAAAANEDNSIKRTYLIRQIEKHAENKEQVLTLLKITPSLELNKRFGCDFRETWRRVLIDGSYDGIDKTEFLSNSLRSFTDTRQKIYKSLQALLESHNLLFGSGHSDLMIRNADDPAFKQFGARMSLAQAIAGISEGNEEQVQAFKTIFETGQNNRGYVHKLECHAESVEFIYAVTDIVYGVMLPAELNIGPKRVTAEPAKVHMFYIKAGDVIALHPYVLHSGSLSVEPDKSFSIIIYKKPAQAADSFVRLPDAWQQWQQYLKLPDIDKYYLTLEELHTVELTGNKGYITASEPVRLPVWQ